MAPRHVALVEGIFPATAKLLRIEDDSNEATVVASGLPTAMRRLADDLNVGYALAAEKAAARDAEAPADEGQAI